MCGECRDLHNTYRFKMVTNDLLVFCVVFIVINTAYGTCPHTGGSPPCLCSNGGMEVDCSNRIGTTSMPNYIQTLGQINVLNLNNNSLSTIGANDFSGTNPVKLDLSYNNISYIHPTAFNALSHTRELRLKGNNLLVLDDAFGHLPLLSLLDVRDNGIAEPINLRDDIMKELGDTITTFYFGHENLHAWPQSLDHFQGLEELTLDKAGGRLQIIPPEAFHSFQSTLLKLTIRNTQLKAVPLGVGYFRRLEDLHFDHNHMVKDEGIIIQALNQQDSKTIHTISFIDDNLSKFPRALKYVFNLRDLDMSGNNLKYITDESVDGLNLISLALRNCNLERVPGILQRLGHLNILDLSHNNIVNVERNDMDAIVTVEKLDLSYNPLMNIVTDAFRTIRRLTNITLSNTNLKEVPAALKNVTYTIPYVDLSNNDIECMCEYTWLADRLQADGMQLKGNCGNIYQSLCLYVKNFIPECPSVAASRPHLSFNCAEYTPQFP